tara:strand:+ start:155 stop:289 length:135 start_codon:yes stop_codon:yes gene_type:complete
MPFNISWLSKSALPSNINHNPAKKNTSVEIRTPKEELRFTMSTP